MDKEKEQIAINRLKAFAPKDGEAYYLCYSGGKDSDVIRILASLADVPHEIHHNLTTVDAPETVQYIKSIPGVIINKARKDDGTIETMWSLIREKMMPPTRIARYCCSRLKERGGRGRLKITGVRWDESTNRAEHSGMVNIIGKPKTTQKYLAENDVNFRLTKQGGVVLNFDNESVRDNGDFIHHCYRDRSVTVNPIVDWTHRDVWEFLHHYGCDGNPLYQCGQDRIGCIGCPLQGSRGMEADFIRYQKYRDNYVRAFDRMLEARREKGKPTAWQSGEEVMKWWLEDDTDPNQLSFFDDEYAEIMEDTT